MLPTSIIRLLAIISRTAVLGKTAMPYIKAYLAFRKWMVRWGIPLGILTVKVLAIVSKHLAIFSVFAVTTVYKEVKMNLPKRAKLVLSPAVGFPQLIPQVTQPYPPNPPAWMEATVDTEVEEVEEEMATIEVEEEMTTIEEETTMESQPRVYTIPDQPAADGGDGTPYWLLEGAEIYPPIEVMVEWAEANLPDLKGLGRYKKPSSLRDKIYIYLKAIEKYGA